MPAVCLSHFLSLPSFLFTSPHSHIPPSLSSPLPSSHFLHLPGLTHPPPSPASLLRPLLRNSHPLPRRPLNTRTLFLPDPPRCSCLQRLMPFWGCLCLLSMLIHSFILDGRGLRPNSTQIVAASVLIAKERIGLLGSSVSVHPHLVFPLFFIPSFLDSRSFNPPQRSDARSFRLCVD